MRLPCSDILTTAAAASFQKCFLLFVFYFAYAFFLNGTVFALMLSAVLNTALIFAFIARCILARRTTPLIMITNNIIPLGFLLGVCSEANKCSFSKHSLPQFHHLIAERASQPVHRQCTVNNNTQPPDVCSSPVSDCNTHPALSPAAPRDHFTADVYLGGSCRTSQAWRNEIAIPLIEKHGLTYYNPAVREMNEERMVLERLTAAELGPEHHKVLEKLVLEWKRALDQSRVLLFVITKDTRSLTTMILASYYIGVGKSVVLCVQQLNVEDCQIDGEKVGFEYVGLSCGLLIRIAESKFSCPN